MLRQFALHLCCMQTHDAQIATGIGTWIAHVSGSSRFNIGTLSQTMSLPLVIPWRIFCVHVCIGVRFLTQDSARAAGRRDQSGDWCLSRSSPGLSSRGTWHARHTTRPARRAARKP